MIFKSIALAVALATSSVAFAGATLDRANSSEAFNFGVRANSVPYSSLDASGNSKGYSLDICKDFAKYVGTKTGKTYAVTTQEVNGQTRQPLVLNGSIQLECGSTSYTEERAKVVNFFIVDADPVVPATLASNTSIKSLDDFKGKRVAVVAGTTAEKIFKKLNSEKGWGTTIIITKDYPEAFLTVEQGRVDAVATNGVLLAGEIAKLNNGKFKLRESVIIGEAELIGIMYGKNDAEFTALVKEYETKIKTDGTLERLYTKWFAPLNIKWTAEQRKSVLGK